MNAVHVETVTGRVVGVMSGFRAEHGAPELPGCHVVEVDHTVTMPAYFDGKEVLPVPTPPAEWYEWNWQSKAWEFDLNSAKEAAWLLIKANRNGREFGPFSWSGHVFDGDIDAQRRINLAVLGAQVALGSGQPWTVDWTLADNSFVTLSAADMVGVAEAMGASINAAHDWARGLRIQIDAASTIEELEAAWPASS